MNFSEQLSWGPAGGVGNQAGPGNPGVQPGQQALSVVTTVWGVTQSSQSGPFNQNPQNGPAFTNTTMSGGTPYTQQQSFPGNPMQKPGNPYNGHPQGMPNYNRSNSAPVYNKPK